MALWDLVNHFSYLQNLELSVQQQNKVEYVPLFAFAPFELEQLQKNEGRNWEGSLLLVKQSSSGTES